MIEDLKNNGKVSLNTVEDFEKLKSTALTDGTPNVQFVGVIENEKLTEIYKETLSHTPAMTATEVKDPDGEVVSIKNLHLVLCGSLADAPPEMKPESMKDFAVAVAKTATYHQRHLPIWQKLVLLWKMFAELFLNKSYIQESDPYVMVAARWYRKQQIPAPKMVRLKIFLRRIRDMFVYTPDAEPIDTYGMPGFNSKVVPPVGRFL
jgi:hypothetical protein